MSDIENRIDEYRKQFPVTSRYTFLDHAAVSPMGAMSMEAIGNFIEESHALGKRRYEVWGERLRDTRASAARLVGASGEEIAFIPNTSTGINHIARGLPWKEGDNVVSFTGEFPANIYPWMNLAGMGVELRLIPEKTDGYSIDDIDCHVDNVTRLLSISSVEFRTGLRNDLEVIGEYCKSRGILFFVDGIQSLGAFPMDVKKNGIDFLAADAHKWMIGPEGAGIMYVSEEVVGRVSPAYVGWNSVRNAFEFLPYDFTLKDDARKFELGSLNLMDIFAMGAIIDFLLKVGIENIGARILELTDRFCEGLAERGWDMITSRRPEAIRSGIVSFRGVEKSSIAVSRLAEMGIIVSDRLDALRVSPHFYNTFDEIDMLLEVLGPNG